VASTLTNLFFIDKYYESLIFEEIISIDDLIDDLIDDKDFTNYIFSGYNGSLLTKIYS